MVRAIMTKSRPFRSHRIPACVSCRKRRSKCSIESIGYSCVLCRAHGIQCSAASLPSAMSSQPTHKAQSMQPRAEEPQPMDVYVVPPVVARDTQVLDELLATNNVGSLAMTITRRPSPNHCDCSRGPPLKLLQEIEINLESIIQLYLKELSPCLPVLGEKSLRSKISTKASSQPFWINLTAYTLSYWHLSPKLKYQTRPDDDFAWQVACSSMNVHDHVGGLASIVPAILNIAGRPSKGVVHNMANVARIVALSNSIRLNHDCSGWHITEVEKNDRCKAWWAVLIHDRWFHFAQGTPPLISAAHYNVPIPSLSMLTTSTSSEDQVKAAQCYIALCSLTEILGDILPLIYHVRAGAADLVAEQVAKSQSSLDVWLNDSLEKLQILDFKQRPPIRGLVNLQISYLSVRMLLERLYWYEQSHSSNSLEGSISNRCRIIAELVVSFVDSLQPHNLIEFWLPYNAQHFTSAVTLLLRCAVQTDDSSARSYCFQRAKHLVSCLREYSGVHKWDLADIALPQSETIFRKIEQALPNFERSLSTHPTSNMTVVGRSESTHAIQSFDHVHQDGDIFNGLCDTSLEELFPGIISSFDDYDFFDQMFS